VASRLVKIFPRNLPTGACAALLTFLLGGRIASCTSLRQFLTPRSGNARHQAVARGLPHFASSWHLRCFWAVRQSTGGATRSRGANHWRSP
jgi:hypothetical protein